MTQKICLIIGAALLGCSSEQGFRGGGPQADRMEVTDTGGTVSRDYMVLGDEVAGQEDIAKVDDGGEDGFSFDQEQCIPMCEGRECGSDGCGGVCGYCPYGYLCKGGICVEYCVPDCTGKICGEDGCGGLCGECKENEFCAEDFTCVLKGCEPQCEGKSCGPDGCGGQCGKCGEGQICDSKTWTCVKDTSCHDVTAEGRCLGSLLQWCENGVLMEMDCSKTEGLVCGYSFLAKKYDCITPEQCKPQCVGKECGPDQCGGECGVCGPEEVCSDGGKCGKPCGDVTETGKCEGDVLVFCHQGILVFYDCAAYGLKCKWDPTGNAGKGWYDCL